MHRGPLRARARNLTLQYGHRYTGMENNRANKQTNKRYYQYLDYHNKYIESYLDTRRLAARTNGTRYLLSGISSPILMMTGRGCRAVKCRQCRPRRRRIFASIPPTTSDQTCGLTGIQSGTALLKYHLINYHSYHSYHIIVLFLVLAMCMKAELKNMVLIS